MSVKNYKPYTPGRRYMTTASFDEITKTKPEKSLTKYIGSTGGRNNKWKITVRSRWGGHKKLYRIVDFKRHDKLNVPARVKAIEYDPYRSARIALLSYADGEKRYVLAWKWVQVGDEVMCWDEAELENGNRKKLKDILDGSFIYNLEFIPKNGGKIIKSAWTRGILRGKDKQDGLAYVKMPSGEIRKFNYNCYASIGVVGNEEHKNIVIGKAGRKRWLGRRPHVRGLAMNPVDHPHGGWEGATDIALKYPKSYSGKPVPAGKKTRKKKKWSDKFIVSRRK